MLRRAALALVMVAGCHGNTSKLDEDPPLPKQLRVCADPNNLPFSNEQAQGFENEIATLLARDLGIPVAYQWMPQRRGFIRNTLKAKSCDVVMGEPKGLDMVRVTKPYYRSSYAFVTRADRKLGDLKTFDDPRLAHMRIGLHAIGDDYANVPPAMALAKQGLSDHIVGYTIYGDYSQPNPPRDLIDAVAKGDIDAAIAWGPIAGYFAKHAAVPLVVTPVQSTERGMSFAIGIGVRKGDKAFAKKLEDLLAREKPAIDHILDDYGVPRS
jgi:quinoprotein dehydrogenase-associated probable ABC transporter substrate-binding protein